MRNNNRPAAKAPGVLAVIMVLALTAPGSVLAAPVGPGGASDPFEPMNRAFFAVHQFIDHLLIRPAAMTYRRLMPRPVRQGLANAISNLGEPAIAVNDFLQGHGVKAAKTLTRFATNTTFGVVGLFDVATPGGLPHHDNDFGLTLARYGAKAGPYFFIPLVGPLTFRDGLGQAAGLGLNPLIFVRYPGDEQVGAVSVIAGGLQTRADADSDLKTLYEQATDPYASLRSFYLQSRYAQIKGGKLQIEALPDFGDDPAPSGDAAPAATLPAAPAATASDQNGPKADATGAAATPSAFPEPPPAAAPPAPASTAPEP